MGATLLTPPAGAGQLGQAGTAHGSQGTAAGAAGEQVNW
jgi:hypothetical protein